MAPRAGQDTAASFAADDKARRVSVGAHVGRDDAKGVLLCRTILVQRRVSAGDAGRRRGYGGKCITRRSLSFYHGEYELVTGQRTGPALATLLLLCSVVTGVWRPLKYRNTSTFFFSKWHILVQVGGICLTAWTSTGLDRACSLLGLTARFARRARSWQVSRPPFGPFTSSFSLELFFPPFKRQ